MNANMTLPVEFPQPVRSAWEILPEGRRVEIAQQCGDPRANPHQYTNAILEAVQAQNNELRPRLEAGTLFDRICEGVGKGVLTAFVLSAGATATGIVLPASVTVGQAAFVVIHLSSGSLIRATIAFTFSPLVACICLGYGSRLAYSELSKIWRGEISQEQRNGYRELGRGIAYLSLLPVALNLLRLCIEAALTAAVAWLFFTSSFLNFATTMVRVDMYVQDLKRRRAD